jgi:N utilization substance protein B
MISRRSIRVKVMQTLYAYETANGGMTERQARDLIRSKIDQTAELFTYLVYLLTEVARYVETDAARRSSKHLPTPEDLNVNTKLAGNTLLWQTLEHSGFAEMVNKASFNSFEHTELIRSLFVRLSATQSYIDYINKPSRERHDEREILVLIFNEIILPDENVDSHLSEHYLNWEDDAEMMQQMVLNYLHKPKSYDFLQIVSTEKRKYGDDLVRTANEKKEICLELIRPKLKNWDAERIAQLDMIIMRLGVCELLFFETIPAKVTINEYIDLAKEYSTPQSGQFVNGILDSIHKELEREGKLQKVEYRK